VRFSLCVRKIPGFLPLYYSYSMPLREVRTRKTPYFSKGHTVGIVSLKSIELETVVLIPLAVDRRWWIWWSLQLDGVRADKIKLCTGLGIYGFLRTIHIGLQKSTTTAYLEEIKDIKIWLTLSLSWPCTEQNRLVEHPAGLDFLIALNSLTA
jgi:hypothetical protein